MPGWEVTPVEPLKPGLLCSECNLLLRDPVQTDEGDRLCRSCFHELKRSGVTKAGLQLNGKELEAVSLSPSQNVAATLARYVTCIIHKVLTQNRHSYNAMRIKQ